MACGILVPDQGLNPYPLQWEHGVLTTGLVGNSLSGSNIVLVFFLRDLAFPRGSKKLWEAPKGFPEKTEHAHNQLLMMELLVQKKETELKRNRMPEFKVLLLGFPAEGYFEVEKMVS